MPDSELQDAHNEIDQSFDDIRAANSQKGEPDPLLLIVHDRMVRQFVHSLMEIRVLSPERDKFLVYKAVSRAMGIMLGIYAEAEMPLDRKSQIDLVVGMATNIVAHAVEEIESHDEVTKEHETLQ
jgi:hypothetical protein